MIYLALWLVGSAIFAAGFALGAAWRSPDEWEELPVTLEPYDYDHPAFRVVGRPPVDWKREGW